MLVYSRTVRDACRDVTFCPAPLVTIQLYMPSSSIWTFCTISILVKTPANFCTLLASIFALSFCHTKLSSSPSDCTLNVAELPWNTLLLVGCCVITACATAQVKYYYCTSIINFILSWLESTMSHLNLHTSS